MLAVIDSVQGFFVQSSSALKKKKGEKNIHSSPSLWFQWYNQTFFQWAHPLIHLLHIWCSHKAFKKGHYAVLQSVTCVAQMLKRSIGTRCIPAPYVFVPQDLLTNVLRLTGRLGK